jgi:uncharacterized protein
MPQESSGNSLSIDDSPKLSDVQPVQRLRELDLLRGFTLLMIFSVNVGVYLSGAGGVEVDNAPTSPLDFLSGFFGAITPMRSYLIFSFVFGYGFIIWLNNRDVSRTTMRRRTAGLIGIGVVHGLFLFEFDILLTYGILGYLLYKLHPRLDDRRLLRWAGWIIGGTTALIFVVLSGILIYQDGSISLGNFSTAGPGENYLNLANGPFGDWASARLSVWWEAQISIVVAQWWGVFTMFLLGAYAGRNNLLSPSERRDKIMRNLFRFGGPVVVVVLSIGFVFLFTDLSALSASEDASPASVGPVVLALTLVPALTVLSSLTYIAGFVWLGTKIMNGPIGNAIAAAGSMSLTGYMTQSLALMLVFTWPGLGLAFRIAPGWAYLGVVGFWMLQCFLAPRWLARYRLGPDEWILRFVTYGRRPKFRR